MKPKKAKDDELPNKYISIARQPLRNRNISSHRYKGKIKALNNNYES